MSSIPRTMEQIFRSNPTMKATITPYISRYQQFVFNTVVMADTVAHPITNIPYAADFIMIVARGNNGGTVNVWNNTQAVLAANVGEPLNAGDIFILKIDNTAWEVAFAMTRVLQQIVDVPLCNDLQRNALNTGDWNVIASAATQTVDVAIGLGPQQ